MAAIPSIEASVSGAFAVGTTTLTASDTLTFNSNKKQLLLLRNDTGGSIAANIKGDGLSSVTLAGVGVVSLAAGVSVAVPASEQRAIVLSAISSYCQGVVAVTGGAGLKASLINL